MAGVGKLLGSQQEANAKAQAANYNAAVNIENAKQAEQQSAEQERVYRVQSSEAIGNQRANYGASGVSSASGSPLDILAQSASTAELDALKIKHAGDMKAWAYKSGAALDVNSAANAHIAGNYGAAGALFQTGTDVAGFL